MTVSYPKGCKPKFTLLYNIFDPLRGPWVGTGWEFFDSYAQAQARFRMVTSQRQGATLRPYHPDDEAHLGAAHRM